MHETVREWNSRDRMVAAAAREEEARRQQQQQQHNHNHNGGSRSCDTDGLLKSNHVSFKNGSVPVAHSNSNSSSDYCGGKRRSSNSGDYLTVETPLDSRA